MLFLLPPTILYLYTFHYIVLKVIKGLRVDGYCAPAFFYVLK